MSQIADSQDVDLDAILGELCALENQYDAALISGRNNSQHSGPKRTSVPNAGEYTIHICNQVVTSRLRLDAPCRCLDFCNLVISVFRLIFMDCFQKNRG